MFKPPIFLQLIFGILGGIGPDLDNLLFMKRTADKLFGKDYQCRVYRRAASDEFLHHGGDDGRHVRVGLEEFASIFGPVSRWADNAEARNVKICRIVEDLGFEVATPAEARATLGLKGADRVKF